MEATTIGKRLRRMARAGARSDPVHFVGRVEVIDDVLDFVEDLPPGGDKGNSVVIMGAPGAGKTALLCETARILRALGVGTVECASVPDSVERVQGVYWKIARHLYGDTEDSPRTTKSTRTEGGAGIGATSVRGAVETSVAPPKIADVDGIVEMHGGRAPPIGMAVVVLVDEIQSLDPQGAAAKLLDDLHTQKSAPVLLVCAGLSNSEAALDAAGLSRIEHFAHLGPLTKEESREVAFETMRKTGEALGIPGSEERIALLAKSVADECDGWPMHIHNCLRAVWGDLADQPSPSFAEVDVERALENGRAFRGTYYDSRIESTGVPVNIVQSLLRAVERGRMPGGIPLSKFGAATVIKDAVESMADGHAKDTARDAVGDGASCFLRMLRSGVVSLDKKKQCASPIPSLSAHVFAQRMETGAGQSPP